MQHRLKEARQELQREVRDRKREWRTALEKELNDAVRNKDSRAEWRCLQVLGGRGKGHRRGASR